MAKKSQGTLPILLSIVFVTIIQVFSVINLRDWEGA